MYIAIDDQCNPLPAPPRFRSLFSMYLFRSTSTSILTPKIFVDLNLDCTSIYDDSVATVDLSLIERFRFVFDQWMSTWIFKYRFEHRNENMQIVCMCMCMCVRVYVYECECRYCSISLK